MGRRGGKCQPGERGREENRGLRRLAPGVPQTPARPSLTLHGGWRPGDAQGASAFVHPCFLHVFKSTLGCGVQGGTQVPKGRSALLCGFRGAGMQGGLCQATGSSPQLVVQRRPWKERGQQTACFQV